MTQLASWVATALHFLLMPAAALLLAGLAAKLRARLLGTAGPAVLMPFRALAAAMAKRPVRPADLSPPQAAAPRAILAVTLAAAALVPSFTRDMASLDAGGPLVAVGLLILARLLHHLLANTANDGRALIAEPALLLAIFARDLPAADAAIPLALTAFALAALAMAEQTPPGTASGADHAALILAAALRHLVFLSLLADQLRPAFSPGPPGWLPGLLFWAGTVATCGLAIALARVALPPPRPARRREALAAGLLLALAATLIGLMEGAT